MAIETQHEPHPQIPDQPPSQGDADMVTCPCGGVTGKVVELCKTCKRLEGQTTPDDEVFAAAMLVREAALYGLSALSVTVLIRGDTPAKYHFRAAAHRDDECGIGDGMTLIDAIDRAAADLKVETTESVHP